MGSPAEIATDRAAVEKHIRGELPRGETGINEVDETFDGTEP